MDNDTLLRSEIIKLMCCSDSDRSWILKNLSEPERVRVTDLMSELEQIGFVKDEALVNQVFTKSSIEDTSKGSLQYKDDLDIFWRKLLTSSKESSNSSKQKPNELVKYLSELAVKHV